MPKLSDFVAPGGSQTSGGTQGQIGSVFLTSLPSNDTISAGDLVAITPSGTLYWCADPSQPLYNGTYYYGYRPVSVQGSAANFYALAPTSTAPVDVTSSNTQSYLLSNGNILLLAISNSTGAQWAILSPSGAVIAANASVPAAGFFNFSTGVVPLSSGGFLLYYVNASSLPTIALYNNGGAQILAPTTIDTVNISTGTTTPYHLNACSLSNGNVALAWNSGGFGLVKAAVYNGLTGAAVVSPYTVATISGGIGSGIGALNGGGYVVAYSSDVSSALAFSMYSNSGAAGATGTTVSTAGVNGYFVSIALTGTSTGGFGIVGTFGGTTASAGALYNGSGSLIGSVNTNVLTGSTNVGNRPNPIACTSDGSGGMVVLNTSSSDSMFHHLNSSGTWTRVATLLSTISGTPNSSFGTLANGQFVAGVHNQIFILSTTALVSSTTLTGNDVCVTPFSDPSGTQATPFYFLQGVSSNIVLTTSVPYMQPRSPIGVALTAGSPGQNIQVQITGGVTTRLSFLLPLLFDYRGSTPIGQYMSIIGNSAILQGIQARI